MGLRRWLRIRECPRAAAGRASEGDRRAWPGVGPWRAWPEGNAPSCQAVGGLASDGGTETTDTDGSFAYEAYPFKPGELTCHEAFLAGWGLPIGELFDLRKLSDECARLNQYEFFLASMAMNMDAGIASPPNAQAIL